ncbi:MAG: DUF5071 domain-containing protein [Candidatus Ventricola sp.]
MEIGRLSWTNTIDEQEKAVSELANSSDIDLKELIMPSGRKDCWANCAKIICARSDQEIMEIALDMFEWLQDLNWPRATDIVSRLKELPADVLRRLYRISLEKAKRDDEWLFSLKEAFDDLDIESGSSVTND